MATGTVTTPPPPPGFTLDQPTPQLGHDAIPPPPPGFTLDGSPHPEASLTDKMVGGWGGRTLMGMASPVLAATQLLGGEKGRAAVAELDAMKQRGMASEGKSGFDWYGLGGSMVPGAGIAKGVQAALPAATSALGRIGTGAAIGAATSAAQPVAESPDFLAQKAAQVGLGAVMGGAVPALGEVARSAKGAPALNPVKAATLQAGQAAGYVVSPSSVNPSWLNHRLESIAGKAAVGQEAAQRNQEITTLLAKRELGLPADANITEQTLNLFRAQQGKPYAEIAKLSPEADNALDALKQARFMGNKYHVFSERSGDPAAYLKAEELKKTAGMIEKQLENIASQHGRPDLVQQLPAARTAIAKSYDIEHALNLGDSNVSAAVIGRKFDKVGEKGMTGELATIGKMAQAFPSVMREGSRVPAPGVSGTDAASSALLGTLGYGAGGPAGVLAAGLPLLRGPARSLVLSPGYQKFATTALSPQRQAMIDALMKQGSMAAATGAARNY